MGPSQDGEACKWPSGAPFHEIPGRPARALKSRYDVPNRGSAEDVMVLSKLKPDHAAEVEGILELWETSLASINERG